MADPSAAPRRIGGLPIALAAYTLWGVMPLYLTQLNAVHPVALLGWRILWTIPICLFASTLTGRLGEVRAALANRRLLGMLTLSALAITINWFTYILAVHYGEFYAASLGYFIGPLVNIAIGTVILKERLTRLQWIAVALATVAVAVLAADALFTLYISLALALTFSVYGLIRKQIAVEALPGLTVETTLLALPSVLMIAFAPVSAMQFGDSLASSALLMGAGVMTASPLLLFSIAVRRMTYSAMAFCQFLAPALVLIEGLVIFKQPLLPSQAVCFALIFVGIMLFCFDILKRQRQVPKPVPMD